MEYNTIDIKMDRIGGPGDEINISIYSDTHLGSVHCAMDRLKAHMDRRAKLPGARFIFLGDSWDFILPRDRARFMPSETSHPGTDDVIDQDFIDAYEFLHRYPIDIMHLGNHEFEVLKRHHTDPIKRLSKELGCLYGGYSGFLTYRIVTIGKGGSARKNGTISGKRHVTFLLHHGAWGGKVVKGFGGARDYARGYEDWDVFAYGHNHQSNIHMESRIGITRNGGPMAKDVYFVNTGTWLESATEGTMGYGERRGYGPSALNSPLITLIPTHKNGVKIRAVLSD